MAKRFKTTNIAKIIGVLLVVLLSVGLIFNNRFLKADENGRIKITPKFSVGGLTDYGKHLITTKSIYTEDTFSCSGLEVDLKFESNISYKIYFYNNLNEFITSTSSLTMSYKSDIPENAVFARIVITPIWETNTADKDKKVKWYSVYNYSSQIIVKVFENQNETV